MKHITLGFFLTFVLSFFFSPVSAQENRNEISVEIGVFSLNKKYDLMTSFNTPIVSQYSHSTEISYSRRISQKHFFYGISVGNIHILREVSQVNLWQNNPEREDLPEIKGLTFNQNIWYTIPFLKYELAASNKIGIEFHLGLGIFHQLYPSAKLDIHEIQSKNMADTRFYTSIDETTKRFGAILNPGTNLSYRLNAKSKLGLSFQFYRALTRRTNNTIVPITSQVQINRSVYSVNGSGIFSGHSIKLGYSYAF